MSDLPYELAPYSDGVDGGEVGCALDALTAGATLDSFMVSGGLGHLAVGAGLHSLAISGGLPQVMVSGKARRRLARQLVAGIRAVTPSIGWTGVSVGQCPKAQVAGWMTP